VFDIVGLLSLRVIMTAQGPTNGALAGGGLQVLPTQHNANDRSD
jgi:hypothetical protein